MLRFLFASSPGALLWGALGLPPDPIGYIGGGFMILAPIVAVLAIARSPTIWTILAGVLATVPLVLFAAALWMLAGTSS